MEEGSFRGDSYLPRRSKIQEKQDVQHLGYAVWIQENTHTAMGLHLPTCSQIVTSGHSNMVALLKQ